MKLCPYCDYANYDAAEDCRRCQASLRSHRTLYQGAVAALDFSRFRALRNKSLAFCMLALMIKVYWGGYGPWPVVQNPTLDHLATALEPVFFLGGVVGYATGWMLQWLASAASPSHRGVSGR